MNPPLFFLLVKLCVRVFIYLLCFWVYIQDRMSHKYIKKNLQLTPGAKGGPGPVEMAPTLNKEINRKENIEEERKRGRF